MDRKTKYGYKNIKEVYLSQVGLQKNLRRRELNSP